MTPQEQKMLDDLMARVDSTRLDDKDPEAAQRIEEWSRRNPDAAYILAQTVLVQSYALEQAKAQIQSLQQQLAQHPALAQQPQKQGSFLGNLFGHKDEPRPQQPAPAYAQPQQQGYAQVPQYVPPQPYGQPAGYPPPGYGAPAGGGSSFLRSAATTAAGVAAGALAFEGIESLMHGFGNSAGFGGVGGAGLGDFGGRPEETVINNYYDSPAPGSDDKSADIQQYAHEGDSGLNTQQDLASDVNVDDDGGQLQADTDLPSLDDDSGSFDDASLDDSASFDDDSFDNS